MLRLFPGFQDVKRFDFGDNGFVNFEFVGGDREFEGVTAGGAAFADQGAGQGDDFFGEVVECG